jgi:hypothetical protein
MAGQSRSVVACGRKDSSLALGMTERIEGAIARRRRNDRTQAAIYKMQGDIIAA